MDPSGSVADPIEAVAARMESVGAPLAEDDGVRRFNELYLAVTPTVAAESARQAFEDVAFLARLDVVFADLYFDATATRGPAASHRARGAPLHRRQPEHRTGARHAWPQAQIVDAIGGSDVLRKQFLTALARNVGFAGRALLLRLR